MVETNLLVWSERAQISVLALRNFNRRMLLVTERTGNGTAVHLLNWGDVVVF